MTKNTLEVNSTEWNFLVLWKKGNYQAEMSRATSLSLWQKIDFYCGSALLSAHSRNLLISFINPGGLFLLFVIFFFGDGLFVLKIILSFLGIFSLYFNWSTDQRWQHALQITISLSSTNSNNLYLFRNIFFLQKMVDIYAHGTKLNLNQVILVICITCEYL